MSMLRKTFIALTSLALLAPVANAKVSSSEAARLKTDLTPFGAVRAGNADGSIPEWTGGLTTPPPEYKGPGAHHPNPFPDDEILYTVTAQNMEKYAHLLTDGQKALFSAYPETYRVPVYKSRRTHAAPDWVYKNTQKNAKTAVLANKGNGVKKAYGGIPFPMAAQTSKDGTEMYWNHVMRWRGVYVVRRASETAVQRNGDFNLVTSHQEAYFNYYNPEGSAKKLKNILFYYLSFVKAPPRLAGGAVLVHETVDQMKKPRKAWGYNAGQRRVRRAPTLAYDTPIAAMDGLRTADDTDMMNGSPDRFNWSYKGTVEKLIPYNNYAMSEPTTKYADLLWAGHINPKFTRYEKHRVHVVEGTLKKGKRHIYTKRRMYIDEDSWSIATMDQYDGRGELWRVSMAYLKNYYEMPLTWTALDVYHDLQARRYAVQNLDSEESATTDFSQPVPRTRYFKPSSLRRRGTR
jgi:hypothetical protein